MVQTQEEIMKDVNDLLVVLNGFDYSEMLEQQEMLEQLYKEDKGKRHWKELKANPIRHNVHLQKAKRYYRRHRIAIRLRSKEYYYQVVKANPQKYLKLLERQNRLTKKWQKDNPKKARIYNLINIHPEDYPLDNHCFYCEKTSKLEHGHIDYENDGHNYVTVCRSCNILMTLNPEELLELREGKLTKFNK